MAMRNTPASANPKLDPILLETFKHRFAAIADEMGVVLRRSSYSPNIKERRDFSCALFNSHAQMVAQAAHIPVHLGSMPLAVEAALKAFPVEQTLLPGDCIILNDPFLGGTHLPDITLISPVFTSSETRKLSGFVASRAHHADVGGISPGSMPIAREIYQEGLIIPPIKLFEQDQLNQPVLELILANVRTPQERMGDLWAQIAANRRGLARFGELLDKYGDAFIDERMTELIEYTHRMTCRLIQSLPEGRYFYKDYLDDDGFNHDTIPIQVTIDIRGDQANLDFTGSAPQQPSSINAVFAITLSAVHYVFRCLLGLDIPNNSGCMLPIHVFAPPGSIVNAMHPSPVAAGNVETSQRIVDVLFGALSQACPQLIPAASQGTMNNLTLGGIDPGNQRAFAYYETIAGGMGARPDSDGPSAMHSHMTNTLNTPVEALEYAYPLRILHYGLRDSSGGAGRYTGGLGIRRDIQLLCDAQATLLSERRVLPPYGLAGGVPGQIGENALIRDGIETMLPGKGFFNLRPGDILSIRTPGGGGWGPPPTMCPSIKSQ